MLAYELGEEETNKQGIGMVELQGSMTTQPSVSKRLLEPFKFIQLQQIAPGAPELLDVTVCPEGSSGQLGSAPRGSCRSKRKVRLGKIAAPTSLARVCGSSIHLSERRQFCC